METRRFDIVVNGATGYTGRLVTQYLARKQASSPEEPFLWAIAGRSKSKLEHLKDTVGLPLLEILIADSDDAASLDALCQQTLVVIACAGPFALHGMPLVDACMKNSTHYVDITGEFPFVRKVIAKHQTEAESRGILIVPMCGFDSVPSDLGNYLVHDHCQKQFHTEPSSVVGYFDMGAGDGMSRGTLESVANLVRTITLADISPVCLNPSNQRMVKTPMVFLPSFNFLLKRWTGPFLMAAINEKVVRRSNALSNSNASYCEGTKGTFRSTLITTVGYYALFLTFAIPGLRTLAKRLFPAPGQGPSEEAAMQPFHATFIAKTINGLTATATVSSKLGGYPSTAVFAVESALCLAHDILAADSPTTSCASFLSSSLGTPKGGVMTPMTAFGALLLPRLAQNGIQFAVQ